MLAFKIIKHFKGRGDYNENFGARTSPSLQLDLGEQNSDLPLESTLTHLQSDRILLDVMTLTLYLNVSKVITLQYGARCLERWNYDRARELPYNYYPYFYIISETVGQYWSSLHYPKVFGDMEVSTLDQTEHFENELIERTLLIKSKLNFTKVLSCK